jgi:Avidin family
MWFNDSTKYDEEPILSLLLFGQILLNFNLPESFNLNKKQNMANSNINTGVSGKWTNSYGSLMNILQFPNGLIWGTYSSTTGSSGTYMVLGFSPYGAAGNQPVALCIYWKSTTNGPPDPTWSWVSMMCGQLLMDAPFGPQLELLHSMVASGPFSAVDVFAPGAYTETLVFTPFTSAVADEITPVNPFDNNTVTPLVLNGQWVNKNSNSRFSNLNIQTYVYPPLVDGTLYTEQRSIMIGGLYNADATPTMLQTVALTGIYTDKNGMNAAITLGGFYDAVKNELDLIVFKSISTTYGAKYACTNILGGEKFVKQ